MDYQQWKDLIPFYVAKTLTPEEQRAFEAYVAQCGDRCRQEVEDWRLIAAVVWTEADSVAKSLPPLSQEVYNRLNYRQSTPATRYSSNPPRPDYAEQEHPERSQKMRPTRGFPVTAVAGIVVALMMGGLLLLLAFGRQAGDGDDGQEIALLVTDPAGGTGEAGSFSTDPDVLASIASPTPTLEPPSLVTAESVPPTMTPLPTGIPPLPVIIPVDTVAPTLTPLPQGIGGGGPDSSIASLPSATGGIGLPTSTQQNYVPPESLAGVPRPYNLRPNSDQFEVNGVPDCDIWNVDTRPMTAYASASTTAAIVGQVLQDQRYNVKTISANGFYEIILPGSGGFISGWIAPQDAIIIGNCAPFLLPTPTMAAQAPAQPSPTSKWMGNNQLRVSAPSAELYAVPRLDGTQRIAVVEQGTLLTVSATTSTNGQPFAEVTTPDGITGWIWEAVVEIANEP